MRYVFLRKALDWLFYIALILGSGCLFGGNRGTTNFRVSLTGLQAQIETEIRSAGLQKDYAHYREHINQKVEQTRSEDRARLPWIESLIKNPEGAPAIAEEFTRQLHKVSLTDRPIDKLVDELTIRILQHPNITGTQMVEDQDPIRFLERTVVETRLAVDRAFGTLSPSELRELSEILYSQTTTEVTSGHRFAGPDHGARLVDLILRVELNEILDAARKLSSLTDPQFLRRLKKSRSNSRHLETSRGRIIIGGTGPDVHRLDEVSDAYAVLDFGGDDVYEEGTLSPQRPVLVIIDFGGNDHYRGTKAGIQGGAIMGASLLIDLKGDDRYESADVAQGSGLAGVGILLDELGNDQYRGDRRVQGHGVAGVGILLDSAGKDRYRAALFAQGFGGPLGGGLLIDHVQNDHYFAGGKYADSYEDTPGYGSWSQGVGSGSRSAANGGIGALLDGAGDDIYEADYFSHGGGYWFGAGFVRDFSGNDRRLGPVRTSFDGAVRPEERYLRWGIGFGCHYAAGFVFDDKGDDSYYGNWASIAYAWDGALGMLIDGSGDDQYHSTGSGVAQSAHSGFALLFDAHGEDLFEGDGPGKLNARNKENQINFAFLLDRD